MTALLLPKIMMVVGVVIAAGLVFFRIRQSGKESQQLADTRKTLEQVESREAVDEKIAGMSDADVDRRLHDRWTR